MLKKIISIAMTIILCLGSACADASIEDVSRFLGADVSEMSTDELIDVLDFLRIKANQLIAYIDVVESIIDPSGSAVTVPEGTWIIGEDIPAGRWNISVTPQGEAAVTYGKELTLNGSIINPFGSGYLAYMLCGVSHPDHSNFSPSNVDIRLESGAYLQVAGGTVIFTPSAAKPSLGFDW